MLFSMRLLAGQPGSPAQNERAARQGILSEALLLPVKTAHTPIIPSAHLPSSLVRALKLINGTAVAEQGEGPRVWHDDHGAGYLRGCDSQGIWASFNGTSERLHFSWETAHALRIPGADDDEEIASLAKLPKTAPLRQRRTLYVPNQRRRPASGAPNPARFSVESLPPDELLHFSERQRIPLNPAEVETLQAYMTGRSHEDPEASFAGSTLSADSRAKVRASALYLLSFLHEPWVTKNLLMDLGIGDGLSECFIAARNQPKKARNGFESAEHLLKINANYSHRSAVLAWTPLIAAYRQGVLARSVLENRFPPRSPAEPLAAPVKTAPAPGKIPGGSTRLKERLRAIMQEVAASAETLFLEPGAHNFDAQVMPLLDRGPKKSDPQPWLRAVLEGLTIPFSEVDELVCGMVVRHEDDAIGYGVVREILPSKGASDPLSIKIWFHGGEKLVSRTVLMQYSLAQWRRHDPLRAEIPTNGTRRAG